MLDLIPLLLKDVVAERFNQLVQLESEYNDGRLNEPILAESIIVEVFSKFKQILSSDNYHQESFFQLRLQDLIDQYVESTIQQSDFFGLQSRTEREQDKYRILKEKYVNALKKYPHSEALQINLSFISKRWLGPTRDLVSKFVFLVEKTMHRFIIHHRHLQVPEMKPLRDALMKEISQKLSMLMPNRNNFEETLIWSVYDDYSELSIRNFPASQETLDVLQQMWYDLFMHSFEDEKYTHLLAKEVFNSNFRTIPDRNGDNNNAIIRLTEQFAGNEITSVEIQREIGMQRHGQTGFNRSPYWHFSSRRRNAFVIHEIAKQILRIEHERESVHLPTWKGSNYDFDLRSVLKLMAQVAGHTELAGYRLVQNVLANIYSRANFEFNLPEEFLGYFIGERVKKYKNEIIGVYENEDFSYIDCWLANNPAYQSVNLYGPSTVSELAQSIAVRKDIFGVLL